MQNYKLEASDKDAVKILVVRDFNGDDDEAKRLFSENGFWVNTVDLSGDSYSFDLSYAPEITLYYVSDLNENSFHIDIASIIERFPETLLIAFYRSDPEKVGLQIAGCPSANLFKAQQNELETLANLNMIKSHIELSKKKLNYESEKYGELIDEIKDLYIELDLDGKILKMNKAFETALGLKKCDYLNTFFFTWFQADQRGSAQLFFISVLKGLSHFKGEFTLKNETAQFTYIKPASGRILYNNGRVIGAALLFSNITNLKSAESSIKKSADFEKSIFKALKILAFKINRAGIIVDFNAGEEEKLLMNPDFIIGSDFHTLPFGADSIFEIERAILNALDNGICSDVCYNWVIPEKGLEYFEARFFPASGDLVDVFIWDVTERMKREALIADSKIEFFDFFNYLDYPSFRADLTGQITTINDYASDYFGIKENKLNYTGALKLFFGDYVANNALNPIGALVANSNDLANIKCDTVNKFGDKITIDWKIKKIYDEKYTAKEFLFVGKQISGSNNQSGTMNLAVANADSSWEILNKIFFIRKPDSLENIKEILTVIGKYINIYSLSVCSVSKGLGIKGIYCFSENTIRTYSMEISPAGLSNYYSILKHNKSAFFDGTDKVFCPKITDFMNKRSVDLAVHFPIRVSTGVAGVLIAEIKGESDSKNFEHVRLLSSVAERFSLEFEAIEKKKNEIASKDANLTIKALSSALNSGMAFVDENLLISSVNPAGAKMLAYKPNELTGKYLPDLVPEYFKNVFAEILNDAFAESESFVNEFVFITGSGERKNVELSFGIVSRVNAAKVGVLSFVDTNANKSFEEKYLLAKEQIDTANRQKSEFAENVGVEIKSPINSMLGFVQLLSESNLDNIQQNYVNSINTYGKNVLNLITNLLDFTKLEASGFTTHFSFVNSYDLFIELYAEHSPRAQDKDLNFTLLIDGSLPSQFVFDGPKLKRICDNLIDNALKFTERGFVRLFVKAENINYEKNTFDFLIKIEDSGIGFTSDEALTIFEPFSKFSENTGVRESNFGTGLTVVKKMVAALSGEISVTGEKHKGASFVVQFKSVAYATLGDKTERRNLEYYYKALKPTAIVIYENEAAKSKLEKSLMSGSLDTTTIPYKLTCPYDLEGLRPGAFFIESCLLNKDNSLISNFKKNIYFKNSLYFNFDEKLSFENLELDGYFEYEQCFNIEKDALANFGLGVNALGNVKNEEIDISENKTKITKLNEDFEILEQELLNKWEQAASSSILSEIANFAEYVAETAEDKKMKPLAIYAAKLIEQVSEFEFDKFPETLNMFPDVMNQIKLNNKN